MGAIEEHAASAAECGRIADALEAGSLAISAIAAIYGGAAVNYSPACVALVKRSEGCPLVAYPDPATHGDPWSIGFGATGPGIVKGVRWTQAQADARLDSDLKRTAVSVTALIGKAATSQCEFDALVCFAFNVGVGNLGKSTLLTLHRIGQKAEAAAQFSLWTKAGKPPRVMPGLITRRAAEAALYRGEHA